MNRPRIASATLAVTLAFSALGSAGTAAASGGPVYSHTVYSSVRIGGSVTSGGLNTTYIPAPCWLEPKFTGGRSWTKGDPRPPYSPSFDADTYWWWLAEQDPNLMYVLGHIPGVRKQIDKTFKSYQGKAGWWWAPAWVSDAQGYACGQGLVDQLNLNATYLDFQPPSTGGSDTPGHTINGLILADIARAALALPAISIHTSPPAPATPSEVNLPTWVWISYNGAMRPRDTASLPLPGGGVLSATVRTSVPTLTLSVGGPGGSPPAQVYNNCGARGSRYPGRGAAGVTPACGATFLAPSTAGPYTITATVRWRVTWSDTAGRTGIFSSPPYPPSVVTATVPVSVREIQAVNHG